jgi:hypothetical protein
MILFFSERFPKATRGYIARFDQLPDVAADSSGGERTRGQPEWWPASISAFANGPFWRSRLDQKANQNLVEVVINMVRSRGCDNLGISCSYEMHLFNAHHTHLSNSLCAHTIGFCDIGPKLELSSFR